MSSALVWGTKGEHPMHWLALGAMGDVEQNVKLGRIALKMPEKFHPCGSDPFTSSLSCQPLEEAMP
jgi:hypothetical protein